MIVTRPKMAHNDVCTPIIIGIDRRGLFPPLPQCLQEILHRETSKKLERSLRHSSYNMSTFPPRRYIVCGNSLGVQSNGNVDFKIRHDITCTSRYFPESVSYRAMGRLITLSSLFTLGFIQLVHSVWCQ